MAWTADCQIEIDTNRGVLWVHSTEGHTLLRVCGLDKLKLRDIFNGKPCPQIDITHPERVTYGNG